MEKRKLNFAASRLSYTLCYFARLPFCPILWYIYLHTAEIRKKKEVENMHNQLRIDYTFILCSAGVMIIFIFNTELRHQLSAEFHP